MGAKWTLEDMESQAGKRFLITGANSGVGYSAAVQLAKRGAIVVLACRDTGRGKVALRKLKQDAAGPESAGEQAELVELDLASLRSVRAVAEAEVARRLPLHGLINNAGIMAPPKRGVTKDGFELQFGTNVLGHFALTCRLMPALQLGLESVASGEARVVTLASIAHKRGRLNFEDLQSERSYSPRGAYSQSKLADLMFALELDRRMRAVHFPVRSIAVHPGVARTSIVKIGNSQGPARLAERFIQGTIGTLLNSELGGAIPTLFAATSPDAESGGYYGSQGFQETRGGDVGPAKIAPQAEDVDAQRKLWEVCAELTGVNVEFQQSGATVC